MDKKLVLDLETEKSFDEVGGRNNFHMLGVTVVGVYDYETDKFYALEKEEFDKLIELFKKTTLLIGFNIKHFDIPVLRPHINFDLSSIPILDLMDGVERAAGFRISLDNLSHASLGESKSGKGLDAIDWWREGKKDKVKKYCIQDVKLTRDLYEFGKKNGEVFFESKYSKKKSALSVDWRSNSVIKDISGILRQALKDRKTVSIKYDSGPSGRDNDLERLVDIYSIDDNSISAFCHLRKGKRIFSIGNIKSAEITANSYKLEQDVQQSLI